MNALLLGSGGWIPTSTRETCCVYVRHDAHVLLLDAGTGLQRLVEKPVLLGGVHEVDIVLTHFHLDHVVGLAYLPALELPKPPVVWGPGEMLHRTPTAEILRRLLEPPFVSTSLGATTSDTCEIPAGQFELGSFELSTRVQPRHTSPSLAVRVGDLLTYCTDTAVDPGNAQFAAGSRLLLHEAWYAEASTDDATHSAAGEAGCIAREAGVEGLVLIHINPQQSSEEALLEKARAEFSETRVGEDLLPLLEE